jgi:hypothetical protein
VVVVTLDDPEVAAVDDALATSVLKPRFDTAPSALAPAVALCEVAVAVADDGEAVRSTARVFARSALVGAVASG